MNYFNGKVGINAGHLIDSAVHAKGLAQMAADVDVDALLARYQSCGLLGRNASRAQALELKKRLVRRDLQDIAAQRARDKQQLARQMEQQAKHPLSYPIKSKEELIEKCKGKTPAELLDALGISTQVLPGGQKELSHYGWAPYYYTYKTAGIDEKQLLENVESIKGTCNLLGSSLESLGSVKSVGKLVVPQFTTLKDLSGLKYVGEIAVSDLSFSEALEALKKLNLDPSVVARRFRGFYR